MLMATKATKGLLELPPALRRSFWSTASPPPAPPPNAGPEIFDLVCVGGGPAGLSLVSALRSHPSTSALKVALIDSQELASKSPGSEDVYSNRCSSLTPSSLRFLKETGAWNHVDPRRAQPYHMMDVWDGVSGSKIHFNPLDRTPGIFDSIAEAIPGSRWDASRQKYGEEGADVVATMCENSNLTSGLLNRLRELRGVEILDKTKVSSIDLGPEPKDETSMDLSQWPILTLGDRKIAARLLVGADGANSPVRQFADIASHGWDYNQHGVVATLNLESAFTFSDMRSAYQRFLPTGPIALLPLPNNKASLVWSTSPAYATKLKQLPPASFAALVNAAFRLMPVDLDYMITQLPADEVPTELAWREKATDTASLGLPSSIPRVATVQEGSIASFPLRMRHASTYTGHRVALLGDAAHTIHPLAGQGLNLGLADSEALAACIADGVETGMDIGSSFCLDKYNSRRWAANNAVMGVVDKLKKLYSASSGPVVWGRSFGLDLVNRLGSVKGAIMKQM